MKTLKMLLLLLLANLSVHAQIVTIKDRESGMAIERALLMNQNQSIVISTNAKGMTDITQLQTAGLIEINAKGYEPLFITYTDLLAIKDSIYLSIRVLNLDEIVVSGSRFRQKSSSVPYKILSIPAEDVKLQNPQTSADLLGISGRVFIQKSQQGGGSPMIRGFAANRLLYSIDGVRMNNAIFRAGNLQQVINIDPFTVENTEILLGNGSVIYGSDAIGGVMSFSTIPSQFSLSGDAIITGHSIVRYSSANSEKTVHTDISVGWKRWAIVSSFSSWDFDHLRQGKQGPDDYLKPYYVQLIDSIDHIISQNDPLLQIPSGYRQQNLMQKLRFAPNQHWDFQYAFHYSETSDYGRYDRHNRTKNGLPRYGVWNYGPQIWMMNMLTIHHTKSTVFYNKFSMRLAVQNFEESRIDRNFGDFWQNTQTETVDAYSVHIDLKKDFRNLHLYYGIEYILNIVKPKGISENILSLEQKAIAARYPQSDWQSAAIYGAIDWRIAPKWLMQCGLRYNYYLINADFSNNHAFYPLPFAQSHLENNASTGNMGFVYKPTPQWSISTNLSSAFRAPNIDDMGKIFDSEPGKVVMPNPDLKPEYAIQIDLSSALLLVEHLKVDASIYRTNLKNAIVRRPYSLNGLDSILYFGELSEIQALQNASEAQVWGIQGGWDLQLPQGFEFSGDMNFQQGTETMDDGGKSTLRHAPPFFGTVRTGFMHNKLHYIIYLQFQAEKSHENLALEERDKTEIYAQDANGNTYAPGWYTLNTKISYQLSNYFSFNAGMENISNQRYRPYSSGISGAGRNIQFSIKLQF